MPIFDVKRCRNWFAKNCTDIGAETFEEAIAEMDNALAEAAPTPQCLTLRMLIGLDPVAHPAHPARCGFCRRALRYFYFLYATEVEVDPYFEALAREHKEDIQQLKRRFALEQLGSGEDCFGTVELISFDALPKERQIHRFDCVSCSLRIEFSDGMTDVVLGGAA